MSINSAKFIQNVKIVVVFKVIDGELTNIFKKTQSVSGGFNLASNEINKFAERFNKINKSQNFGLRWDILMGATSNKNANVATYFEELAKQGASARASIQGVYAEILDGNTKGINNVKSIINTFNSVNPQNQKDFAAAVGQTNVQLGNYLANVQGGTASMKGYVGQLVATKAATIGLQLATVALNMGITAFVNLAIWGITKLVNQMSDLAEEIDELQSDLDDTKSEIEDINSSLEENKRKIEEINNNPLDITNKETLTDLQLENAELERQKKLLEEIEKQKAKELNNKTVEYLNKKSELNTDGGYWASVWNNIKNPDSVAEDLRQITDKNTTWAEKIFNAYKVSAPILGAPSSIANIIDTFIPETRSILDETQSYISELETNLNEIETTLNNGISIDSNFNALSETFNSIDDLRSKLTNNIETLNNYRDSLSETSEEYKAVSKYIEEYTNQLDRLDKLDVYDTSGFTDEYFKIKEEFENGFDAKITHIRDNQSIDSSISNLLNTAYDDNGEQYYTLAGSYIEQFEKVKKLLSQFDEIELNRELTFDESIIKSSVENYYNALDKEIKDGGETYVKGKSSEASVIFNDYLKNNPIEEIGEDTYLAWKDGLLALAQGDTEITDVLNKMIIAVKPQINQAINDKNNALIPLSVNGIRESIDKAFSNQSLIQSAFDKIKEGASLSAEEVKKLIELCPSLTNEFKQTADGYTISADKLINANESLVKDTKTSLQERADYLKSFINTPFDTSFIDSAVEVKQYNEWQDNIEAAENELSELNLILSMFGITTSDVDDNYSQMADDVSKKTNLIKTAMTEMRDSGHISVSTYAELAAKGDEYVDCLEIQNGKLVLNVDKLKDLEAQEYKNAIAANSLAIAQIKAATSGHVMSEALQDELDGLQKENTVYQQILSDIYGVKPDSGSGGSSKPDSIVQFENDLAKYEHEINMGRKKEDSEFYDWLDKEAHKAYEGQTEYQDELWRYEEQVYNGRKKLAEEAFDNEHDLFEKRVDDLEQIANKISETSIDTDTDGTELTTQEKYREIVSVYEEIRYAIEDEINRIVQAGVEGHEDLLKELEKQSEEYSDKIADTFKSAVEAEKALLEKAKGAKSSEYDDQIDKVKSQQEAAQKAADAEIEAIQTKIDNLQKVNDEKQREYDIEKAKQELEKAKNQRTRMVYGSDGRKGYETDPDAINEAQKSLDDLLLKKQIDNLENQKTILEEMRDKESASYDTLIADIEYQKEQDERQFDILLQYLDNYLNPTGDTSNADVWSAIAKVEGAKFESGKWYDKDGNIIDIDGLYSTLEKDKDEKIDTSAVTNGDTKQSTNTAESNTDIANAKRGFDIIAELLKKFNAPQEVIDKYLKGDLTGFMTSYMKSSVVPPQQFEGQYKIDPNSYEVANRNATVAPITIGDIVINNPVGNSNDLAKEIVMNLPNAVKQRLYSNIKK